MFLGVTVGKNKKKKRVYPNMDCEYRTKDSFVSKIQCQHHKEHVTSPLQRIINFDPVNFVVLDSMHLLHLGIMKYLMESWIGRKSVARLRLSQLSVLREMLLSIKYNIPCEFQRKAFDIRLLSRWKATQFRCVLLYCGFIVFKNVLPEKYYKHYLLLFVACRILHSKVLILENTEYAKELLRKFFFLLPSLYGDQSQTLNHHNLIHIADDVQNLKMDLSCISAFWGENYIGIFKKFVKSPHKPLTQIVNRLSEIESRTPKISRIKDIECNFKDDSANFLYGGKYYYVVTRIKLSSYTLKTNSPDNIVQLDSGIFFMINVILLKGKRDLANYTPQKKDIFLLGYEMKNNSEVFNYPTSSVDLGVICVNEYSEDLEIIPLKRICNKCILFDVLDKQYIVSQLHV